MVYLNPRIRYIVNQTAPAVYTVVSDEDGIDTLFGIEVIEFSDTAVRINSAPKAADDIMLLGRAYINRLCKHS